MGQENYHIKMALTMKVNSKMIHLFKEMQEYLLLVTKYIKAN